MKFPIRNRGKGKWATYPMGVSSIDNKCPMCDNNINKGDFVCLNIGGISNGVSNTDDLFVHMSAHFDSMNLYGSADIVDCKNTEQLDLYVCSIDCMRKFFMKSCDELEKKTFPQEFRDSQINKIV